MEDIERDLTDILHGRLSSIALDLLRAGDPPGDPEATQVLQADMFRRSMATTELHEKTAHVLESLNREKIAFLVMKGPAVARFHPALAHRPHSDIDILLSPADYKRATGILEVEGYSSSDDSRPPREWFRTLCVEGMNYSQPGGGALDVHHHLAPWAFTKTLEFESLYRTTTPGRIGGAHVRFLGVEASYLVAALHVLNDLWKGDPSLLTWRDLVVLRRVASKREVESVFASASLQWFLPFVEQTLDQLEGREPIPVRFGLRFIPKYIRLYGLGWQNASMLARHPAGWALRLPPLRGLAYLAGWLVPSAPYVRERHGGYVAYWKKSVSSLRRVAGGADLRCMAEGLAPAAREMA